MPGPPAFTMSEWIPSVPGKLGSLRRTSEDVKSDKVNDHALSQLWLNYIGNDSVYPQLVGAIPTLVGGPIAAEGIDALRKLLRDVHRCEIALTQLGYIADLNCSINLKRIIKRLPRHLQRQWAKLAIGANRVSSWDVDDINRRRNLPRPRDNAVASKALSPPVCTARHFLYDCTTFQAKSPDEKLQTLRERVYPNRHECTICTLVREQRIGNSKRPYASLTAFGWVTFGPSVRIPFDFAANSGKLSPNDCLYSGPDLTNDLTRVLLRFRLNDFALYADIEEMILEVHLKAEDGAQPSALWEAKGAPGNSHDRRNRIELRSNRASVFSDCNMPAASFDLVVICALTSLRSIMYTIAEYRYWIIDVHMGLIEHVVGLLL
ncbi:hypothetical protein CLF_100228 [Clonorchis sinensis]|uniref:Uncharacterized protein n=1 Tax=Clonorchis sinensis TaxID=79923 RepID=G7Y2Y6_CLOSI|nr:hypothetical protein CLF_100228 [Clonorchis sinensis]